MRLFWHRRDLRVRDNTGLAAAAAAGSVAPVFIFDPDVLRHGAAPRVSFMLDGLAALTERYRELGSDLLIRSGKPANLLPQLCAEVDASGVVWNEDYSGLASDRDEAVEAALAAGNRESESHTDAVLHEPGEIRTNAGDPYQVFTYFWRKWREREKAPPVQPPTADDLVDITGDELPTLEELGFTEPDANVPEGSMEAARERLQTFCDGPIFEYADARDRPAAEATSGLSPHLKFGTVGIREVYQTTEEALEAAEDQDARESVREFQSQLAWREFYAQVLFFNPDVVQENYQDFEAPIEWRDDPDALRAWQAGETGFPIVDAGMRQLREEAIMHNRVRMIVASFLTKDLLIDWRTGYEWFRRMLVDHDTANDSGGWQWAASTGTDAQPYFRIFNPMTQGERYDPKAEYIKRYVPELRGVSPDAIHQWDELEGDERDQLAPAYPQPIVDHGERRELALEMFEAARGDSN